MPADSDRRDCGGGDLGRDGWGKEAGGGEGYERRRRKI